MGFDTIDGSDAGQTFTIQSAALDMAICLCNQMVMERIDYSEGDANLDSIFAALADPTRRAILAQLAKGEASVGELAAPFSISQPAVSKHLRILEHAGLIERGIDKQRRPARLKAEPMAAASDWLESYRSFWSKSFDRMDELLKELKKKKIKGSTHD